MSSGGGITGLNRETAVRSASEKFIQQTIELHTLLIGLNAINLEKWLHPFLPQVAFNTSCCQGKVLEPIADPQASTVDEAAEATLCRHEVRQARVAMGHYQVMSLWLSRHQFGKHILSALPQSLVVEVCLVHEAGNDVLLRASNAQLKGVIEGAEGHG